MVYAFEIIGLLFALVLIYSTYLEYRRKHLSGLGFIFWTFFWILGSVLIVFHTYINSILDPLNIVRVLDFYMILSFMFLFALVFYIFVRNRIIENKLESITRAMALKPLSQIKQINGLNEHTQIKPIKEKDGK